MRFGTIQWALAHELPPQPKLLLVVLACHASRDNHTLMSQLRLAGLCGASTGWVRKHSCTLEDAGLVHVSKRVLGNDKAMNEYHLLTDTAPSRNGTVSERYEALGHLVVTGEFGKATLPLTYESPDVTEYGSATI